MLSHFMFSVYAYRMSLILTSDFSLRSPGKCLLRSKPSDPRLEWIDISM